MRTELVEAAGDAAAFTRGGTVAGTILHSDPVAPMERSKPCREQALAMDLLGQRRLRIAVVDGQARVLQTPRVHNVLEYHCRT
jgi:hypothetical protein